MKARRFVSLLLVILTYILVSGSVVMAGPASGPYDLTGTWQFQARDVERSFCDGALYRESIKMEVEVTQNLEELTMIFPDDPEPQTFFGRTSKYVIGAESVDGDQTTVLSGRISQTGDKISGKIAFFDKNECPDAETGYASFAMTKISP